MPVILHWAACLAIGGPCALALVGNGLALIGTLRTRKPVSMVLPFLAGLLCALACRLSPSATLRAYAWVPLVADVGLLALVFGLLDAIFRWTRGAGPPGDESKP